MTTELARAEERNGAIVAAGQLADEYARVGVFADYWQGLSANAQATRRAGLSTWRTYLCEVTAGASCPEVDELAATPAAWAGVTWGLVKGFVLWMGAQGYSVATLNNRLTTVRVFASLAHQAGAIPERDAALIATVKGYSMKKGRNLDEGRAVKRVGAKKGQHTPITREQALAMMRQPNTPQGRRDAVIMTLLLDHGLRVGEVAALQVTGVDLAAGELTFDRPKTKTAATIELTARARRAVEAYMRADAPAMGPLLRGSVKGGALAGSLSERAIQALVRKIGAAAGVEGLSPHDCRHYAATFYARRGVDVLKLMSAFGWNSPAMARRYVEESKIANEGTAHLAGDD